MQAPSADLEGINYPIDLLAELTPAQQFSDALNGAIAGVAETDSQLVFGRGFRRFEIETVPSRDPNRTLVHIERGLGQFVVSLNPDLPTRYFRRGRPTREHPSGLVEMTPEEADTFARTGLRAMRQGVRTRRALLPIR